VEGCIYSHPHKFSFMSGPQLLAHRAVSTVLPFQIMNCPNTLHIQLQGMVIQLLAPYGGSDLDYSQLRP
jgi:hypothetical protein